MNDFLKMQPNSQRASSKILMNDFLKMQPNFPEGEMNSARAHAQNNQTLFSLALRKDKQRLVYLRCNNLRSDIWEYFLPGIPARRGPNFPYSVYCGPYFPEIK